MLVNLTAVKPVNSSYRLAVVSVTTEEAVTNKYLLVLDNDDRPCSYMNFNLGAWDYMESSYDDQERRHGHTMKCIFFDNENFQIRTSDKRRIVNKETKKQVKLLKDIRTITNYSIFRDGVIRESID